MLSSNLIHILLHINRLHFRFPQHNDHYRISKYLLFHNIYNYQHKLYKHHQSQSNRLSIHKCSNRLHVHLFLIQLRSHNHRKYISHLSYMNWYHRYHKYHHLNILNNCQYKLCIILRFHNILYYSPYIHLINLLRIQNNYLHNILSNKFHFHYHV